MQSNNTFLETRIQRLLDGLFFVEKGLGVTCSACSKWVGIYILAEIVSKILGKKRRTIGDFICDHDLANYRFGANLFFLNILCDHCLHDYHLYNRAILTYSEMVTFQKWDFFRFSFILLLYLHFHCESLYEPLHLRCGSYFHEQIDLSHTHIRAIWVG